MSSEPNSLTAQERIDLKLLDRLAKLEREVFDQGTQDLKTVAYAGRLEARIIKLEASDAAAKEQWHEHEERLHALEQKPDPTPRFPEGTRVENDPKHPESWTPEMIAAFNSAPIKCRMPDYAGDGPGIVGLGNARIRSDRIAQIDREMQEHANAMGDLRCEREKLRQP